VEKAIAEESLLERTEAFSIDPRLGDARTVRVSFIPPFEAISRRFSRCRAWRMSRRTVEGKCRDALDQSAVGARRTLAL